MSKSAGAAQKPSIEATDLVEFWVLHQKKILTVAIGAAVLVTGTILYRRSNEIKELRGEQAYAAAEAVFMSGNKAVAVPELEKVVTRYAGTPAGAQAAMLIAQSLMEQGKADEAITQLRAALSGAPKPMRSGIHGLIGAAHEGAGKPAEAAAAYAQAAAAAPFTQERDMHLIEQARNLIAANDLAGAERIYSDIARNESSPFAGEARVRLGEVLGRKQ